MQQDKTDIFGVSRIWVLSSLFCLLPPGCILTGFRNFSTFPLFSEIPLGCNQDATGNDWYSLGLEDLDLVVIVFPVASWSHPNGISIFFNFSASFQNPVRMQPGCNRKKVIRLGSGGFRSCRHCFSCCILVASQQDLVFFQLFRFFYPVRMQPGCGRKRVIFLGSGGFGSCHPCFSCCIPVAS